MRHNECRDEQGATIVMIALTIVGILAFTGLAIDGGRAFANRRQQQNAADAAALAGASQLNREMKSPNGSTYGAILNAVTTTATADGGTVPNSSCRLIDQSGNDLGQCPMANPLVNENAATLPPGTDGVRVTSSAVLTSSFMQIVGVNTFSGAATSAAQVEALVSISAGASPFMVCAVAGTDPRSNGDGLGGTGQPPAILNTDNSINSAAIGQDYQLQFPNGAPACGLGSNWKGLDDGTSHSVPGSWPAINGDHGANVARQVISGGGCSNGVYANCLVLAPLCYGQDGSHLFCARFGVFLTSQGSSSSRSDGVFQGGAVVVNSGQGGGIPGSSDPRVIKLTQ